MRKKPVSGIPTNGSIVMHMRVQIGKPENGETLTEFEKATYFFIQKCIKSF